MQKVGLGVDHRVAALVCAAVVWVVPGVAFAQSVQQAPAADAAGQPKKTRKAAKAGPPAKPAAEGDAATPAAKDPSAALAAYSAGVKAYQVGKFDAAEQSLSTAISSGALAPNLLPKALYYRGAAYQQSGKSGQAVSDLTSALYFKSGLDDAERAEATRLRAAAYQAAGAAPAQVAPAPQETGSVAIAANPSPSASASQGLSLNAAPSEGQPAKSGGGSLDGIGNLFGNLFGQSSSSSEAAAPSPAPAKVAAAETAPAQAAPAGEPEVLPWQRNEAAQPASNDAAAASGQPAAKPKKPGQFRIQVASVKSRDEASAVISKLQAMGGAIASTPSSVDEATFGTMGTFYRVRLGPYATMAEARASCSALKAQGLDCLVTPK